ncbi:MAG: hypothetical protein M1834_005973 [Cirrosporium novae-zelandiae]|nr:MAG: hypothetical protein M1834_005973 [Cirrosporium novae-zelandiae]
MASYITFIRRKTLATLLRLSSRQLTRDLSPKEIAQIEIESREKERQIKLHVYNYPHDGESQRAKPVLINWHGSGFIIPALGSDALFCSRVSNAIGITVIDADYRKAPEHPFPAGLEDVCDVIEWVFGQPEKFDPEKIALSGFSAGGNLALVASSSSNHGNMTKAQIRAILAFYPPTNLSIPPETKQAIAPIQPIPSYVANFIADCYIPPSIQPSDPRISPAFIDASTFPENVLIVTCEGDNLCLEAEELASEIVKSRGNVVNRRLQGVGHAWDKSAEDGSYEAKVREEAYSLAVNFLCSALKI